MSCTQHIYKIERIPEWEYIVKCVNCDSTPNHTICSDDAHVFVQLFSTIENPNYGYVACENCGHTGAEIKAAGGKVNPHSNIWGIKNK